MAIDPNNITTVRVGELPSADFNLTDKIPHEIGETLFNGTIQKLADLIGDYLGTTDSLAFNPTTVLDGGTLPTTSSNEWMLVGKGTFHNVGGGLDIVTTEELNAITSNGSYWSLAVEIPINVELAGITQNIRSGYTETTPSEDAIFKALALKLNISDAISSIPLASETVKGLVELATQEETTEGLDNSKAVHPLGLSYAIDTKTTNSAGAIQGFAITNNGDGTVNIASGTAYLRATNDQYAPIAKYTIPAVTNLSLTDNANNFVLVDYNGGTPAITVTTNSATINTETNSIAAVISRVGNVLDWISLVGQNNDANAKIRVRFLNQEGIRRANGAVIGFANRNLTLTAGTLFSGLIRINSPAFNTASPDTFTYVYNNGSVWTRVTGQTQVSNTQYNNAGTLATMPNNTFRTDYVYLLPNNPSKLYVVYGAATYANITLARTAPVPSSLPSELQVLGLLVGRQIIEKNAAAISEVSSAFADVFTGVGVPEHNALAGLQGGAANDYQHLTTAQVSSINANGILEYNTTDKTVWSNGKGNIASNTGFGDFTGANNTTGNTWSAFGNGAGYNNTTGNSWTAIGAAAGNGSITGGSWTALGYQAGNFIADGTTPLSSIISSIFIGAMTKALNNASTNEIVIGTGATGNGDNSLTLGNPSIKKTVLKGRISQSTTAEVTDANYDGYYSEFVSDFDGYNFHAVRTGTGGGGAIGAANLSTGIGDGVIGRRRMAGEGNGGTFKREETGNGHGIYAEKSGSGSGIGALIIKSGSGAGEAANIQNSSNNNSAAAYIQKSGASNGDAMYVEKVNNSVGYAANLVGGQGLAVSGAAGGITLNSTNVNLDNISVVFINSAAAKSFGLTMGKSGVSNDGFGFHNRTDGTYPLFVSTAGVVNVPNLSGTGTRTVVADASGNLSAAGTAPTSGTYTPTITNLTNASSPTSVTAVYTQIGNIVSCTISFSTVATSTSTSTGFEFTLPVARGSGTTLQVGSGSVSENTGANRSVIWAQSATTTTAVLRFTSAPSGSTTHLGSVTIQYSI